MTDILKQEHIHLWTRTLDGAELGNAIYVSELDAAVDFTAIARNMTKYNDVFIPVEDVMRSLTDGLGMYAGSPGFVLVVSRCGGGCLSPSWN